MKPTLATRAIWWKEIRQLMPLAYVLIGVAVFTYMLSALSSAQARETLQWALFAGLPSLFAVGAGALVVGQEKELRTLQWLNSMPISRPALLRTKLLAALLGLALMWIVSLVLAVLFQSPVLYFSSGDATKTWDLLASSSNTLFLLVAGFALAWRLNSILWSLILLAVVALIPHLLASAVAVGLGQRSQNPNDWFLAPAPTLFAVQLFCSIVAIMASTLFGRRALGAAAAPRSVPYGAWSSHKIRKMPQPFDSPFRALTWQWYAQNKLLLRTCIAVSAGLCVIACVFNDAEFIDSGGVGFVWLLLASALGISVFQSDDLHNRIRFFADRGVAPVTTWLSRIAWPGIIFSVSGVCLFVCLYTFYHPHLSQRNQHVFWMNLAMVCGGGIAAFAVSQWVGQLIFSPIVAIVAAPAVTALAIGFGVFSVEALGTPYWLAVLSLLILPVATAFAMREWMDRRKQVRFWGIHSLFLAALCCIHFAPISWIAIFEPGMSAEIRQEIAAQADADYAGNSYSPVELYVPIPGVFDINSPQNQAEIEEAQRFQERGAYALEGYCLNSLEKQISEAGNGRSISPGRVVNFLRSALKINRLRIRSAAEESDSPSISDQDRLGRDRSDQESLDQDRSEAQESEPADQEQPPSPNSENSIVAQELSAKESSASQEELRSRYNHLFEVTLQIIDRVREDGRNLKDLDATDILEFALVKELVESGASDLLDTAVHDSAVQTLTNIQRRQSGRKLAILEAIRIDNRFAHTFGGYVLPSSRANSTLAQIRAQRQRARELVEPLWLCATRPKQESTAWRTQLVEFLGRPPAYYGLGDGGTFLRGSVSTATPQLADCPGALWNAAWEQEALQLSGSMHLN